MAGDLWQSRACHVFGNALGRVCWRDGTYVNLDRVKPVIEWYASNAAFRDVIFSLTRRDVAAKR